MRLRLTSDWSYVGVEGVDGMERIVAVRVVAVEGVDGTEEAKRLSEGDTGTVFRRRKSGVGASFDRLCFESEKLGCGSDNMSDLPFDDNTDVCDVEGEVWEESDPNEETDDDAECMDAERSCPDFLLNFAEPPTGRRVMGSSGDSRR